MAEYIAACASTKEVVWLQRLLGTFGINFTKPTLIRSDNQPISLHTRSVSG
jgi:hypothetical protein